MHAANIGLSSASHPGWGDPDSTPSVGLIQITPITDKEIINFKIHITPVSLTDWHIMILLKNTTTC